MNTPTAADSIAVARTRPRLPPEVLEAERLAFEAWVSAHFGWELTAKWSSEYRTYLEDYEAEGEGFTISGISARRVWAAWRDRAALAYAQEAGQ